MEYRQNIHNIPKAELKKRLRANDSLNKYKKKNPNIIKKQNIESNTNHEDIPTQRLRTQLTEISLNEKERENPFQNYEQRDHLKKPSLNEIKYQLHQARTPRRDYRRKHNLFINSLSNRFNNTTYLKTTEDYNNKYETDTERKSNIRELIRDKIRNRYYSRPNFHRLNQKYNINDIERRNDYLNGTTRIINRSNYVRDNNIKMKEIITLNNILNKQNNEMKLKIKETTIKLNEFITKQNKLISENQYIKKENKNLLMNLSLVQNELNNLKNMTYNEIESKTITINELNNELNQIKNELNEKDEMIINLQNINNNNINNINNKNTE